MTTLTKNELAVLKAIDDSEYGDNILDGVWTWSVWDNVEGVENAKSFPGIISSLVKKGYVTSSEDSGNGEDDACIDMTNDGFEVYAATVGRENINKWLDQSDLDRWKAERENKH